MDTSSGRGGFRRRLTRNSLSKLSQGIEFALIGGNTLDFDFKGLLSELL